MDIEPGTASFYVLFCTPMYYHTIRFAIATNARSFFRFPCYYWFSIRLFKILTLRDILLMRVRGKGNYKSLRFSIPTFTPSKDARCLMDEDVNALVKVAVKKEQRTTPVRIQRMPNTRANKDLGTLSPYLHNNVETASK